MNVLPCQRAEPVERSSPCTGNAVRVNTRSEALLSGSDTLSTEELRPAEENLRPPRSPTFVMMVGASLIALATTRNVASAYSPPVSVAQQRDVRFAVLVWRVDELEEPGGSVDADRREQLRPSV